MNAREQEKVVFDALGDEALTSRRLEERIPHPLSLRQIAAALGRLGRRGRVRSTEMRCLVCDGRGRVRVFQKAADLEDDDG